MASPNLTAGWPGASRHAAMVLLGNTLAVYPPLRVAEEFALIDCMSDGRLAAGLPVGSPMDVTGVWGIPPDRGAAALLRGPRPDHEGVDPPGTVPLQRQVQEVAQRQPVAAALAEAAPPVWLAGGGSLETFDFAANHDYTYSYLSFFGYKLAKKLMDAFWETAGRRGADANPYRAGFAQQSASPRPMPRPRSCTSSTSCTSSRSACTSPRTSGDARLPHAPQHRVRAQDEHARSIAAAATARSDWESLVDQGFVIAGSPDTVTERLIEACHGLRVGNLVALLQIGSMPHELTKQNITLFAEQVMPRSVACGPTRAGRTAGGPRAPVSRSAAPVAGGDDGAAGAHRRAAGRPLQIRVLDAGEGDPVLFLHGVGGLSWDACSTTSPRAPRHRAGAPGHRGSQDLEHVEDHVGPGPLLRRAARRPRPATLTSSATPSAAWWPRRSPPPAPSGWTSWCSSPPWAVARRRPRGRHLRRPAGDAAGPVARRSDPPADGAARADPTIPTRCSVRP